MKKKQFSDEFKFMVIQEILSGTINKEQAKRKYGIKGSSAILQWMRKFNLATENSVTDSFELMKSNEKRRADNTKEERIKLLEQALKAAELKAEGYSRMIEIAEQQLNIKIRKK